MRHGKKFNHLGRTSSHRKAMLSNMASSLILHKRIRTTLAKAKALRIFVEPLLTDSKEDSTHSRRLVFSYLQNKEAVSELFREISKKIAERHGGYTRILKTGTRLGDNAEMCIIELVDYNENLLHIKEETTAKTTRRRRSTTKKTKEKTTAETEAVKEEEEPSETVPKKRKKAAKQTPEDKVKETEERHEEPSGTEEEQSEAEEEESEAEEEETENKE
jgi:large subunit ribosomal protein L17